MSNELSKSDTKSAGPLADAGRRNLLDRAYENLSPEQRKRLGEVAATAAIEQAVKDVDAHRRFDASGADMQRHVGLVREHEKIKSDFTISSDFDTASGRTTVKVSKSNNTLYIVVAVVVAVIFLALFAR